jgi:hypothetical protein
MGEGTGRRARERALPEYAVDVAAQPLHAQAHAALDRTEWNIETGSDLDMRELTLERLPW